MTVARNTWPYTTPSGHTYEAPTTYADVSGRAADMMQATIESWPEAEHPPEPSWEMVGICQSRVIELTREKDVLKANNEVLRKIMEEPDKRRSWAWSDLIIVMIGFALGLTAYGLVR